jgi:hypothetical protein
MAEIGDCVPTLPLDDLEAEADLARAAGSLHAAWAALSPDFRAACGDLVITLHSDGTADVDPAAAVRPIDPPP